MRLGARYNTSGGRTAARIEPGKNLELAVTPGSSPALHTRMNGEAPRPAMLPRGQHSRPGAYTVDSFASSEKSAAKPSRALLFAFWESSQHSAVSTQPVLMHGWLNAEC